MRLEVPSGGTTTLQSQQSRQSNQGPAMRSMNLYSPTNQNGLILSTSNLTANRNLMMNNQNNNPLLESKGGSVDVHHSQAPPVTSSSGKTGLARDMNSNHLIQSMKGYGDSINQIRGSIYHLTSPSSFSPCRTLSKHPAQNSPTSSEEDNSPTEMNSCRKFIEKPPLVKRLTMGLLMKTAEDSRPLVYNHSPGMSHLNNNNSSPGYNNSSAPATPSKGTSNCDGYVNEGICDRDRGITNKLGESPQEAPNPNQEFNYKKNLLRETTSGKEGNIIFHEDFN